MRRTEKYAAMTKDAAQRSPSSLLRAVSPSTLLRTVNLSNGLSNGRWTFYEAVKFRASSSLVDESMAERALIEKVRERFPSEVLDSRVFRDEVTLVVQKDTVLEILRYLHDDLDFDLLTDLCGVDHFPNHPRFEVVYHLSSLKHNDRVRIKAPLEEGETISTVESVWKGANWYERETFDLFGIVFENHSNLKRILLWDEFDGHPLRKDFPTEGEDFEEPLIPEG